jgi:hypothetical protein|tara:strand:+ start:292 stop:765 length:474 start_codon:yes stop_codon:yes gene_type:complete
LTDALLDHGYTIYNEIIESTGTDRNKFNKRTISKEDYFALCEKCDIRHTPKNRYFGTPFKPIYANVAQFIYNGTVTQVDKKIEKIFEFMPFLDSDFIALLNRLRHSDFYKRHANMLIIITQGNIPDKKIGKWDSMYEYLEIVREIENYNQKHHLKYK